MKPLYTPPRIQCAKPGSDAELELRGIVERHRVAQRQLALELYGSDPEPRRLEAARDPRRPWR